MQVDLKDMDSGVHLLHFSLSNCSQRVRICLSEKDIPWESHVVDMLKNEHSSEWFQSINPKGLILVLVDDGEVITESLEIIKYLDKKNSENSLFPENESMKLRLEVLLDLADLAQSPIKLLTHEFLFKPSRFMMKRSFKNFSEDHKNSELVEFRRRFINNEFKEVEIKSACEHMHESFRKMDEFLNPALNENKKNSGWLLDEGFSLADVAWMVNVHRMDLMGFPLERYQYLSKWFDACKQRKCFDEGLRSFEPALMRVYSKLYGFMFSSKRKRLYSI